MIIVAHVRCVCFKLNLYIQVYQEILVDPEAPGFLFHPVDQVFLLIPSVLWILLSPLRKHVECLSSLTRLRLVAVVITVTTADQEVSIPPRAEAIRLIYFCAHVTQNIGCFFQIF